MGKQPDLEVKPQEPQTEDPLKRIAELEAALETEKAKNQRTPMATTLGKQPLDEFAGYVPKRDPVVSKMLNGTKRVDF